MELILWRHAEAAPGDPDAERRLTAHGQRQAEAMARFLTPHLPAALRFLVSPARRTRETAESLARPFETLEALSPASDAPALLAAVGWPDASRAVLVVGHQPTLGEAVARLLSARQASWPLGTGSVCWIRSKPRTRGGEAELLLSIEPEILEREN
jgi:phosphohistidine phosphatase